MLLWAGFQVICVPVIPFGGRHFRHVMIGYSVYLLVLLVLATVFWFRNPQDCVRCGRRRQRSQKTEVLLWVIFAVLLLIQLVLAVVMVYGDGDDAYYVAISTAAQESGKCIRSFLIPA